MKKNLKFWNNYNIILFVEQNGVIHVSVKPCNDSLKNWMLQGTNSIYTKKIMLVTKKWSD